MVGFYSTSSGYDECKRLIDACHSKDVLTIYGGIHAISTPLTILSECNVDAVCVGYGEEPIYALCKDTTNRTIRGLYFKENAKNVNEFIPHFPEPTAFDDLLSFDHELFLNELGKGDGVGFRRFFFHYAVRKSYFKTITLLPFQALLF